MAPTCTTSAGAQRYLSVRVARINLDEAVNYLVSMHDMTSWQQRLRNEQDAHRVASRILSITADGVIIADESQAITYANESAEKMFGYDTGELLGSPLETLIPPRFHEAHAEDIARFLQSKQPSRLMAGRTPVTALTKAGQEIPVDVSITRVNQHGKAVFSALVRLRED